MKPSAEPVVRTGWFERYELRLAFLAGVAAMTFVQTGTYEPSGRDSFYHTKMAVLLPRIGFPEQFHWLRHTILNDRNVSHHHGFHVMMVPFVHLSQWCADAAPPGFRHWAAQHSDIRRLEHFKVGLRSWLASPYILGGKFLNVVLFGLVVAAFQLIIRHLQVSFRLLWLCAVFALPTDFLLRMSYIRAPIASLLILLLVLYCCLTRRLIWVAVLGALYCHVYGGFVFYPVVVFIFALSGVLTRGAWKDAAWLALASCIGSAVGLLSHPFFPENLAFLKVQLFETGLQTAPLQKVRVGSEWKPINADYWLQISAVTLAVLLLSLSLRLTWRRLAAPDTLSLLLLNVFFLGLCFHARRFIEYWPVFCLLSSAALWRGAGDSTKHLVQDLPQKAVVIINALFKRVYILVGVATLVAAGITLAEVRRSARCKFDVNSIRKAMNFLQFDAQSPKQSLVFADDWDEFPLYFYYNDHNDFVCGLDPQFTNSKDPVLWERFCVITQGRAPKQSTVKVREADGRIGSETFQVDISDIKTHFAAQYVIVDKDHQKLYRQLKARPDLFRYLYPPADGDSPPDRVASLSIFAVVESSDVPRETPADGPG